MLTIRIDDEKIERSITEQAKITHKSKEDVVKVILSAALSNTGEALLYQKLKPSENGYFIQETNSATNIANEEDSLYSFVEDSKDYVANLRKSAWRKK